MPNKPAPPAPVLPPGSPTPGPAGTANPAGQPQPGVDPSKMKLSAVIIDEEKGVISIGGRKTDGLLTLSQRDDQETVRIQAKETSLEGGLISVRGRLSVNNLNGAQVIDLSPGGRGSFGNHLQPGEIEVLGSKGKPTVAVKGGSGDIELGGNGQGGTLLCKTMGDETSVGVYGNTGRVEVGGNTVDGTVRVRNAKGDNTLDLDGKNGDITVGGPKTAGRIQCVNADNKATVEIKGAIGDIDLGGNETNGNLRCLNASDNPTVILNGEFGDITLGGNGTNGNLKCLNKKGAPMLELKGETGDVWLAGADCAEYVAVHDSAAVAPGTVLVATDDGKFAAATSPYDRRVVGVVSGAGNLRPGLRLNIADALTGVPLALTGRVYCLVDSSYGPIQVGDLLVTSPTPGHAMRATDPTRSFGAIIGKALGSLSHGRGMIVVLVALG